MDGISRVPISVRMCLRIRSPVVEAVESFHRRRLTLSRARGRLDGRKPPAGFDAPPPEIVEEFMRALRERDLNKMKTLCADHLAYHRAHVRHSHSEYDRLL